MLIYPNLIVDQLDEAKNMAAVKYKILHYKNNCISCGACAAICPEFYEMDEEGIAQLKGSMQVGDHWERNISSEDDRVRNQEAADVCPVQIIKIEKVGEKKK